jgi:hypothetical protein
MNNLFSFEITSDQKVKVIYLGNKPVDVVISTRMIGGEIYDSVNYIFYEFSHWYIPPFTYKGCTHITIFDLKNKKEILSWILPSDLSKSPNKQNIICLGLNKTGTTSFETDLRNIGYTFLPTSFGSIKLQTDVYHGDFYSTYSALNNPLFNAYQDSPFSLPNVYRKIYENRPNDIYILTERSDVELWVESVKKNFGWFINDGNAYSNDRVFDYYNGPEHYKISNFCALTFHMWGIYSFSDLDNKLRDVYNRHNDDVMDFFDKKNSRNFMKIDVSKPGELLRLTKWLGVKNDKKNFSWENKTR